MTPLIKSGRDARLVLITKAADQTVNNSAVLQNDNEFEFDTSAGKTYFVILALYGISPAAADIKFQFVDSGGNAGMTSGISNNTGFQGAVGIATPIVINTIASSEMFFVFGLLQCAVSDTVHVQWAQNAATVGNTILYTGSKMLVFS